MRTREPEVPFIFPLKWVTSKGGAARNNAWSSRSGGPSSGTSHPPARCLVISCHCLHAPTDAFCCWVATDLFTTRT